MALEDSRRLPSGRDLPSSDGVPMESDRHRDQAALYLIEPLRRHLDETGFVAWVSGNTFVYYVGEESRVESVGPDMYVVNGGVPSGQEKWVQWDEEWRLPTLVVELLSPATEKRDRGRKFTLYQDVFRCPDYFLFNTTTARLEAFRLEAGQYLPVLPDADGAFACSSLPGLRLAVRDGWLRFICPDGQVLPTGDERARLEQARAGKDRARARRERIRADQERMRADQERMRAGQERMRAEEERARALEADTRALEADTRALEADMRARREHERADVERARAEELQRRLEEAEEALRRLHN